MSHLDHFRKFEPGQPIFICWVAGTDPEPVEFAGITERGSFLIWKHRRTMKTRHELFPNEVGIAETPEQASSEILRCFDYCDLNENINH